MRRILRGSPRRDAQIMAEYRQSLDTAPTTDEARDQAQALEIADKTLRLKALRAQLEQRQRRDSGSTTRPWAISCASGPAGKLADQSLSPAGCERKGIAAAIPFRFSRLRASARPQVVMADALGGFRRARPSGATRGQCAHRLAPGFSPSTSRDRWEPGTTVAMLLLEQFAGEYGVVHRGTVPW